MTAIDTGSSTLVANYTDEAPIGCVLDVLDERPRTAQDIAEEIGYPLRATVNALNLMPAFARRVVPNRDDGQAMAARWVVA